MTDIKKYMAPVMLFVLIFLPLFTAGAETAGDLPCITLETVYYQTRGGEAVESDRMTWQACTTLGEQGREIVFSTGSRDLCRVTVGLEEDGGMIAWQELRSGRTVTGEKGFLLVSGYPAPCDFVPLDGLEEDNAFYIEQRVGDRTFRTRYHVRLEDMMWNEALDAGMVGVETHAEETLRMVQVFDERKTCVLKQLWSGGADAAWWLYEETRTRKTWRRP